MAGPYTALTYAQAGQYPSTATVTKPAGVQVGAIKPVKGPTFPNPPATTGGVS